MNSKDTKTFYLYQFFSLTFLLLTTKYLNIHGIINIGGQMDAISYIEISKYFPNLPTENDIILQNAAQRFIIPYAAGLFSNIFMIDLITIFRVLTALFLIFYIFLITFITDKLKLNLRESILLFSLLFLNPYIARYHLFNPIQSHDMLFFCFCMLFAYSVITNKFILIPNNRLSYLTNLSFHYLIQFFDLLIHRKILPDQLRFHSINIRNQ